jgi:hypothetical protein
MRSGFSLTIFLSFLMGCKRSPNAAGGGADFGSPTRLSQAEPEERGRYLRRRKSAEKPGIDRTVGMHGQADATPKEPGLSETSQQGQKQKGKRGRAPYALPRAFPKSDGLFLDAVRVYDIGWDTSILRSKPVLTLARHYKVRY